METRRLDEALIGFLTIGKSAELGRQLVITTDKKFAEKVAGKGSAETFQKWGPGYVAFDAVIGVTGVLSVLQAIRKNRKGAGMAALIQGGTLAVYSFYYLIYSLFALKGLSFGSKLINIILSFSHAYSAFRVIKFAQRALK